MQKPKILFIDIESSPAMAYVWGRWQQNIAGSQVVREGNLLTWSAKWLDDKRILSDSIVNYNNWSPQDDKNIVKSLWKLVDEADIIVAHNGDSFDIPMMNARFMFHKMQPPSFYRTIDTKRVAKSKARFPSNKLDDLLKHLDLGKKLDTGGFKLWSDCMNGDVAAFNKMQRYNNVDVRTLERLYLALRPWMDNHPNVSVLVGDGDGCTACGHTDLEHRGFYHTNARIYRRLRCKNCGKWNKAVHSEKTVKATVKN